MRQISAANQIALQQRQLVARDFLRLIVRRRDTGTLVAENLWSDVGNVIAEVINPDTGLPEAHDWYGSSTLVQIDDIPLVSNLSVQNVNIRLNQIDDRINDLIRLYDAKQGRVEVYRGLFDPSDRLMVAPAECRFVGFIDQIDVTTPSENEEGGVVLTCASHTQEMTRSNPDTRSDNSQRLRFATDDFYVDTSTAGEWELFWGAEQGKVPSNSRRDRSGSFF